MPSVLLVDDEKAIRLLCRINLEFAGMTVLEAEDGRSGLELARAENPDLILLDVMMPSPDGFDVAEQLRGGADTRCIPIVFLTARDTVRDRARALELGAVDYLVKPFDPVALPGRVQTTLERMQRGEREQLRAERLDELRSLPGGDSG